MKNKKNLRIPPKTLLFSFLFLFFLPLPLNIVGGLEPHAARPTFCRPAFYLVVSENWIPLCALFFSLPLSIKSVNHRCRPVLPPRRQERAVPASPRPLFSMRPMLLHVFVFFSYSPFLPSFLLPLPFNAKLNGAEVTKNDWNCNYSSPILQSHLRRRRTKRKISPPLLNCDK